MNRSIVKILLVAINIILIALMIPPIEKNNSRSYSDGMLYTGTVTLKSDYQSERISLPQGTRISNPLIWGDLITYHQDGDTIRIPISYVQEEQSVRTAYSKYQTNSVISSQEGHRRLILGFFIIEGFVILLSVLWFIIMKSKAYSVYAYAGFTVILLFLSGSLYF